MNKQKIGKLGENIACRFLHNKGFRIIARNFWRKWGEIDIVAKKDRIVHFVEVKTVSSSFSRTSVDKRENREGNSSTGNNYRPEENVHPQKLRRIHRAIQSYLIEQNTEEDWQIDVVAVSLDVRGREARCRFIQNVF